MPVNECPEGPGPLLMDKPRVFSATALSKGPSGSAPLCDVRMTAVVSPSGYGVAYPFPSTRLRHSPSANDQSAMVSGLDLVISEPPLANLEREECGAAGALRGQIQWLEWLNVDDPER